MAEGGITLAELAKSGRHVIVQCGACPNRRLMKPTELGVPLTTAVAIAGPLLKCSKCGSKRVLTYPESNPGCAQGAHALGPASRETVCASLLSLRGDAGANKRSGQGSGSGASQAW